MKRVPEIRPEEKERGREVKREFEEEGDEVEKVGEEKVEGKREKAGVRKYSRVPGDMG